MKRSKARWVGPFQLRKLLENCMDDRQLWPPESKGVYVVTLRPWKGCPRKGPSVLYVGGNTGKSPRFMTRVGDLVADMLGLWYHHSGGQWLYNYCEQEGFHPLDLYLGWVEGVSCSRCAENEVYQRLSPKRREKSPARCKVHTADFSQCPWK
jgi:hypothetical protein